MKPRWWLLPISALLVIEVSACGTKIDAGENSRKHQEKINQARESGSNRSGNFHGEGSCFGTVTTLPAPIEAFCSQVSNQDKEDFQIIYETLCEERRLANLVLPECGWDGRGGDPERAQFLKVINSTPEDDPTSMFYYFSAYSLTLPPQEGSFKDVIFFAHGDPDNFNKKFGLPDNADITPSPEGVIEKNGERQLKYKMRIDSAHGPSSFTSLLRGYTVGDDVDIIWDRALSGKRINMRRHLSIAFRLPDNRNKVLIFEEREVDDQYAHRLARTVMKQFDLRRMEMYYDYARM